MTGVYDADGRGTGDDLPVERMLAVTAETIEGVSFNLELLWERLQQPGELPRERVRSAVWAAVKTLRECGSDLTAANQALSDVEELS